MINTSSIGVLPECRRGVQKHHQHREIQWNIPAAFMRVTFLGFDAALLGADTLAARSIPAPPGHVTKPSAARCGFGNGLGSRTLGMYLLLLMGVPPQHPVAVRVCGSALAAAGVNLPGKPLIMTLANVVFEPVFRTATAGWSLAFMGWRL